MITETLKALRSSTKITQAQLARSLGVTRSSVNAWETGVSKPSIQILVKLADFFNVSSDLLLGLSKNRSIGVDGLLAEEISILLQLTAYFRSNKSA